MTSLPLGANVAAFVLASALTWAAGARVTRHVDELAARTGTGRSFLGALVLGGITSLPEAATVTTAAAVGGSAFAVSNVMGSASTNVAILAAGDVFVLPRPLLDATDRDAVQRQAGLLVVLLALTMCAVVVGEPFDLPVGLWTATISVGTVVAFVLLRNDDRSRHVGGDDRDRDRMPDRAGARRSAAHLVVPATMILAAGYAAARTGTAIAEQTGLSGGFVGFVLLAVSTSLPEVSTTIAALRLGRPTMAFGNVLGTNIFNHVLFLPGDIADGDRPLFASMDPGVAVGAAVAVGVVGICIAGLARAGRTEARRVDPAAATVLVAYVVGAALVYAAT